MAHSLSDGLCRCGCGQATKLAERDNVRLGYLKGQSQAYINGHHVRGRRHTEKSKRLMSASARKRKHGFGEHHYKWKGDAVGRIQAHAWLNRNEPKRGQCEHCGEQKRTQYAYKGPNGEWTRNRADYLELCPSCHKYFDLGKPPRELIAQCNP